VDVPGASAELVVKADSGVIALRELGLGQAASVAHLDAEELVAIDLNAAAGRLLDVAVRLQDLGLPVIDCAPLLSAEVALHLAPLEALGERIPSFLLDETYRAELGGPPSLQPVLRGGIGVAVRAGRVDLSSSAAARHVVADAGQTLLFEDHAAPGEHPLLGRLRVTGP
jgi:hypothetical protein